ncbi:MAG: hypothetical protein L0229_02145, partial [Blastocatellia bacterium]|nr:hypothetical protein [Blastocatellia bacterium]
MGSGPHAARAQSISTQSAWFAFWSVGDGFDSSIGLNNASNSELIIRPILYNLDGRGLPVKPIILPPRQQTVADIAGWIAESGGDQSFNQGNLILTYDAPDPAYLGAQLNISNPVSSLIFNVRHEMPANFTSSRLEGLWWRHDDSSQLNLALTNTTDGKVTAQAIFTGEQGRRDPASFDFVLAPHQTRLLDLSKMRLPFSDGGKAGKAGGIAIIHTGGPGAVVALGMVADSGAGFSSQFAFDDPAASRSQTLAAAHLMSGEPDVAGFTKDTSFTTIAVLRNTSDEAVEVTPKVSFSSGQEPQTITLAARHLLAQQIEPLDLSAELNRAGISGPIRGAGLSLTHTGQPGSLTAHLSSFDQRRDQVFTVPLKDPKAKGSTLGGCYPWRIDGDFQSIVHIRNTTDEKSRFTIQLDWEGGSYSLPIQLLAPQQEVAIDIRRLRDEEIKDSTGRLIPKEVYCARGKMKIFPERNAYVECAALFLSSEISFF